MSISLSHLTDDVLLRDLAALVVQDRATTASMLAHLGEVDARKLYVPAAYPSRYAYCVGELRLSEDAAYKRIQAARAGREFPAIFRAVEEGRLHLSAVCMLAPHLTPDTAEDLIAAAAHKSKVEVEQLLATRFPKADLPTLVTPIDSSQSGQLAPGQVVARISPLAPQKFALQVTIPQQTHDKLRHVQELLGHRVASGGIAQVLDLALDVLIQDLERRKFAATKKPSRPHRTPQGKRTVSAHVKRTVWARDHGQCTFVSDKGTRCAARRDLEFDHVEELARGGGASVGNLRLRCRAHNQYQAECTFGAGFMEGKRRERRENPRVPLRADSVGARATRAPASTRGARAAVIEDPDRDIAPWLRKLGFSYAEIRRAEAACGSIPDAPLEERVGLALKCLGPGASRGNIGALRG